MYNAVMDRSVIEKVSYDLFKYLTSSASIVGLSEEQSYPGLTWITHWATLSSNFIFCIITCCHTKHNVHDEERKQS